MLAMLRVSLMFVVAASFLGAEGGGTAAVISGKVVDSKTGEGIAKARVAIGGEASETVTGEDGRFTFDAVEPGKVELHVTAAGYGVLKKRVDAAAGQVTEVVLLAGQETAVAPSAAIEQTLNGAEIRDRSAMPAEDPVRAVHNLPGVTALQDYYGQFAVRGAGMGHIGIYYDGVPLEQPFYAVRDQGDVGSLSIINGDMVESASLFSGAMPGQFFDRNAAALDIRSREPGREGIAGRASADLVGASATVEGPLSRKGSALVSVRKSYLGYLLDRLGTSNGLELGYGDVQSKAVYDLAARLRASATLAWGRAQVQRNPVTFLGAQDAFFTQEENYFTRANERNALATLRLNWTPTDHTVVQTQGFWTWFKEVDKNPSGDLLFLNDSRQAGYRQDIAWQYGGLKLAGGVLANRNSRDEIEKTTFNPWIQWVTPEPELLIEFRGPVWHTGAYVQESLSLFHSRLTLMAGGRWDRATVICRNAWQPQFGLVFSPFSKTRLAVAGGRYAQFPAMGYVNGFAAPARPERTTHATVSVDQFLTERMRLHVEAYDRREDSVIYSPDTEFRALADGSIVWPKVGAVLNNSLRGYARGVEISVERRSASRFTGRISYARSYSKYWQPGTDLSFWGDFDSRNAVSAYGYTRLTPTVSVAVIARYGSGTPIPGFWAATNQNFYGSDLVAYRVSAKRNTARMPSYQRIDCRINKRVVRGRYTMTMYGGVVNITNHANWRYYDMLMPPWVQYEGLVGLHRSKTVPVRPAAGLTLDF